MLKTHISRFNLVQISGFGHLCKCHRLKLHYYLIVGVIEENFELWFIHCSDFYSENAN